MINWNLIWLLHMYFNIQRRCEYITLNQPSWMSSMHLWVISLGSKQIWLGSLIASLGFLCNHKLIKQKDISQNVIDLWDIILNKIDCLFSASVVDWFIGSLSASSKGKVYNCYNQVLSITKQVSFKEHAYWLNKYPTFTSLKAWCLWNTSTFLIHNYVDMTSVVLFGACIDGVVLRDK